MADLNKAGPIVGIFASDKGPGDPERASLMTQAGTLFAKRGAQVLCLWENGVGPLPLMTAAQTAGGVVSVLADSEGALPPSLAGVPVRVVEDRTARHALMAEEAQVLCLWENGVGPLPLMAAAQTAGGVVSVLADSEGALPPSLAGLPVRVVEERTARHALMAEEAQVLVVLPGSLASASALFGSWAARGVKRPVVMLNRHKAFEVVKGFAGDVLSHAVAGYDRNVQFADSVDDLWNKVSWVLEQKR